MSTPCACTGEGRSLRPCLAHYAALPPAERIRVLHRLHIYNPQSSRRS